MSASKHKINISVYTNIFLLVYLILHFAVLYVAYDFNVWTCLFDTIATGLVLFLLLYVLRSYVSSYFIHVFEISKWILIHLIVAVAVVWVLQSAFESYLAKDIAFVNWAHQMMYLRALIVWLLLSYFSSLQYLTTDQDKEKEEALRTQHNEQMMKEAELFKLRQQINPHFLFNTLNSINALVGQSPERARNMIQQLSAYFRNNLKKEEQHWISLEEELQDIRLYFEIEKVRFGHRLSFQEHIDTDLLEAKVPPFLLQPLVENAIKYGLYGTIGQIKIEYYLSQNTSDRGNRYLIFSISNPFDQGTPQVSGTGFGLKSIQRRLYLLFGRNDLLMTQISAIPDEPEMKLFTAFISIPYNPTSSKISEHD